MGSVIGISKVAPPALCELQGGTNGLEKASSELAAILQAIPVMSAPETRFRPRRFRTKAVIRAHFLKGPPPGSARADWRSCYISADEEGT